jgi:serine/threonine-protein kinase HipA
MPFMARIPPQVHQLFQGLARKGPGSDASTLRALSLCRLPEKPRVADLGCGSGASTLVLARALDVPILALDANGLALDDLWEAARTLGLGHLVQPRCGDLADPGIEPRSLDLLWSEGAIYHLGWSAGLRAWREHVRPQGMLALTEATWFTGDPPKAAREAWAAWYPGMGTEDENLGRDLGLDVIGHFRLPPQDWWAYFEPLEARSRTLPECPERSECIAHLRAEIELYRRLGEHYGYAFYLLRRP